MEWVQKINDDHIKKFMQKNTFQNTDLFMKRATLANENPHVTEITTLAEFLLVAAALKAPNTVFTFPIVDNEDINAVTKDQLLIHFDDIRVATVNQNPYEYNARNIKQETVQFLKDKHTHHTLHPYVYELFGSIEEICPEKHADKIECYKVISSHIQPVNILLDDTFYATWEYISRTFLCRNGFYPIVPTNWFLGDHIKSLSVIAYFVDKRIDIIFTTNARTHQIIAIDLVNGFAKK
ncbi:hypothetical protein D3C72_1575050 [compost metagenome]